MKKVFIVSAGCLSLSLGILGIFLPLLPTTPFLLLSATLFLKGSRRLYNWIMNNRILGFYIKNYIEYRAITLGAKIFSITLLWTLITTSALLFVSNIYIRVILFIIAVGVTIHLLVIKTLKK